MTDLIEFDSIPCYFFNTAPPMASRVYFKQSTLWEMLLYGCLSCPYEPPQYTIYPGEGHVGRWTMHYSKTKIQEMRKLSERTPWATVKEDMIARIPGMLIRYDDFSLPRFKIWQLTDDVILRDNDNSLRLGVWPD